MACHLRQAQIPARCVLALPLHLQIRNCGSPTQRVSEVLLSAKGAYLPYIERTRYTTRWTHKRKQILFIISAPHSCFQLARPFHASVYEQTLPVPSVQSLLPHGLCSGRI